MRKDGISAEQVQATVRIAATANAIVAVLDAEAAEQPAAAMVS